MCEIWHVADLLISRTRPGVALVKSVALDRRSLSGPIQSLSSADAEANDA